MQLRTPMQWGITCFVIFCHFLFFAHLIYKKRDPTFKKLQQRIVVRTTSSAPPLLTPSTVLKKPLQKEPAVSPTPPVTTPQLKPLPKKPKIKAAATPVKKTHQPQIKKEPPPLSPELVQKLKESIAKIDRKPGNPQREEAIVLPERIKSSSYPDISSSATNTSDLLIEVKGLLIQQLQSSLHLPDFGEVKIQLELSESGKVENVKVLKAASQKNHEYLVKELPRISFSLDLHKLPERERIFIIAFHNEINR